MFHLMHVLHWSAQNNDKSFKPLKPNFRLSLKTESTVSVDVLTHADRCVCVHTCVWVYVCTVCVCVHVCWTFVIGKSTVYCTCSVLGCD